MHVPLISQKTVRGGLSDKVTSEQRPKGVKGQTRKIPRRKRFQAKGTVGPGVLRRGCEFSGTISAPG